MYQVSKKEFISLLKREAESKREKTLNEPKLKWAMEAYTKGLDNIADEIEKKKGGKSLENYLEKNLIKAIEINDCEAVCAENNKAAALFAFHLFKAREDNGYLESEIMISSREATFTKPITVCNTFFQAENALIKDFDALDQSDIFKRDKKIMRYDISILFSKQGSLEPRNVAALGLVSISKIQ